MLKSNNYWVSIKDSKSPDGRELWGWCLNHTMTEDPILYSKLYTKQSEAIRLAEKFSEELGIRFVRPQNSIKREFKLIHGGIDEGEDIQG
jgi:tagatose-1,6-bisphosphate aldolase non-catalytic subunit AgaZ/GatZ